MREKKQKTPDVHGVMCAAIAKEAKICIDLPLLELVFKMLAESNDIEGRSGRV